ncbi:MAG: hypothetical protein M3Q55_03815 [Acidobacteriota bacterium]|nr:hypothetical protein [Acidobacteriota bacterium]
MSRRLLPLPIVDGLALGETYRALLRPDEPVTAPDGAPRRLPRYFYQVDSWAQALEVRLSENFSLWEFIDVDLYEPDLLRQYPRYVPCSVTLLAAHLEIFRAAVSATVHISANGGYRSPAHRRSTAGSPHAWATAANIYRIGGDDLDTRDRIERFSATAARLLPGIWTRPYGQLAGHVDDHIHLDLGYVTMTPHDPPSGT